MSQRVYCWCEREITDTHKAGCPHDPRGEDGMNSKDHYEAAEKWLKRAEEEAFPAAVRSPNEQRAAVYAQLALVHAQLAVASATAAMRWST